MTNILTLSLATMLSFGTITPAFALQTHEEIIGVINSEKLLKSELSRIRNHVNECEIQFTVFSHEHSDCKKEFHKFSKTLIHSYCQGEGLIEKDIHEILDALVYAADKHQTGVRNKSNAPYIIHPLVVAEQLVSIGKVRDKDIIIAGLLHDTVEKADVAFEELEELYGSRITGFVREVTDDYSLPKMERRRLQIVNAPGKTAGAAQIDLSDKLYDLSELAKTLSFSQENVKALRTTLWVKDEIDSLPWVNVDLKVACDKVVNSLLKQLNSITKGKPGP